MNEKSATEVKEKKPATILCVDDERNILSALRRTLRSENYVIHLAESGAQGLEILAQHAVDLVISDMRMPEMDGAAFLSQVSERWPKTMRILLTGYADVSSTIEAVNKGNIFQYISKPWDENEIKLAVKQALDKKALEEERMRLLLLTRHQNKKLREFNQTLEKKVEHGTAEVGQTMDMLEAAHESLKENFVASINVLSNVIEMRESAQSTHLRNVAVWSQRLGVRMGMDAHAAQQLFFAAQLRNTGRIVLPDSLINKPLDLMNKKERDQITKSPVVGQAILMALAPLQDAARLIRCQYERFDGLGLPDGLRGEKIPLGARVLSVVSDYEMVQVGLIASDKKGVEAAREYLMLNRGKRYDAAVVDEFFRFLEEEAVSAKQEKIKLVPSDALVADMVLARDLINESGILMLSEGHVFDQAIIEKVRSFERTIEEDLVIYIRGEE